MDQLGQLPLLPSERKSRVSCNRKTLDTSNNVSSLQTTTKTNIASTTASKNTSGDPPSKQDNDEIEQTTPSSTQSVSDTVPDLATRNNDFPIYTQTDQHDHRQHILLASREEQFDRLSSYPPLPVSITSEYVLEYLSTTTDFMNKFQYELSQKFDDCSEKIDRLDRMVGLLESKQRISEKDNVQQPDKCS
jgi:hypothetical protein